MLEQIVKEIMENWHSTVVAPTIVLGALYLFTISRRSYLGRLRELNKERDNYNHSHPESRSKNT